MPYYYSEAATVDGRIHKKIVRARDKKDADRQLRSSGLRPMLIETARAKKKQKEQKLEKIQRVRNVLFLVGGIAIISVGTYLMMLDFDASAKLDMGSLSGAGIENAPSVINATSPEERDFAYEVFRIWEKSFPQTLKSVDSNRKYLMVLYLKTKRSKFKDDELTAMVKTINRFYQRRFDTKVCEVLVVDRKGNTIAKSQFQQGNIQFDLY